MKQDFDFFASNYFWVFEKIFDRKEMNQMEKGWWMRESERECMCVLGERESVFEFVKVSERERKKEKLIFWKQF